MSSRKLAGDDNPIHRAADKVGEKMPSDAKVWTSPVGFASDSAFWQTQNPSILSSGGAIGKQFNRNALPKLSSSLETNLLLADGAIGQIGEKIGGPFSSKGAIGSQFDAAQGGIAGTVERAVDGPSQQGQGTPGKNNGKK